jgi:hypothetical protein
MMMTFGPNDTKVPGVEQDYKSEHSQGTNPLLYIPTELEQVIGRRPVFVYTQICRIESHALAEIGHASRKTRVSWCCSSSRVGGTSGLSGS